MTDIEAHKIYKIVMFLPTLFLTLIAIVAYPYLSYLIGFSLSKNIYIQVAGAVAAFFILGLIWNVFIKVIFFILNEFFNLIIDVKASSGLLPDQSRAVLLGGQTVLDTIHFEKNIRTVDPELIDRLSNQGLFGFLFKEKVSARLLAIVDYYRKHPEEPISAYKAESVLKDLGITRSWIEDLLNNPQIRSMALQIIFFVYLIIASPKF